MGCSAYFGARRGTISLQFRLLGGEGGIRTLGTGVSPYNGLANRRIRPLCHLSGVRVFISLTQLLDFQIRLTVDLARNSRIGGNAAVGSGHTVFSPASHDRAVLQTIHLFGELSV